MSSRSQFICLTACFLLLALASPLLVAVVPGAAAENPATNPAYAKYDFGDRQKVVTFASQPVGVLSAVVPEIMRRDRILEGYLKSQRLELRILPFYSGPDLNHFMRQGKIDIAMAGDFPASAMATESDVQIVAIAKRDKAAVVSGAKYATLRDLSGKRIAFPAGSSSHLGLLVVLEAAGLQESEVTMVPMEIETLTAALVAGKVEAFAGWEPVPTAALAAHPDLKIVSRFLNTDYLYWTSGFAKQKPEVSRQLLAAYVRAIHWLNQSDANITRASKWSLKGTGAFLGKQSELSPAQFKYRVRENLALVGSAGIPPDEFARGSYLNRAFELLRKKGKLPRQVGWEKVQASLRSALMNEVHAAKYQTMKFDYQAE